MSYRERLQINDCLNHPWLAPPVLTSVYPSSSSALYTLSETDSSECPDSAYSSSDNSSPTFLEQSGSSAFAPNVALCEFPIPEEQQQQKQVAEQQERENQVQLARIASAAAMLTSARRLRNRNNYMSVDMEETLKAVRKQQQRSTRRASLVIDNPRQCEEEWKQSSHRKYNHQSLLNLNHEVLDNRMSNTDEFHNATNRLRHSESFDCGISGDLYNSWNEYNDPTPVNQSMNDIDGKVSKPWQKLCNGSVLRAVDQLTTNNSPKKKKVALSKGDLSRTRQDLSLGAGNYATLDSSYSCKNRKSQNSDYRSSISELRAPRPSKADVTSRYDLRTTKLDSRISDRESRCSNYDLRSPKSDIYSAKSDLRSSKSSKDLRRSKRDLQASSHNLSAHSWDRCSDLTMSRLDMSLSRLDLAHEQLDQEEALEQTDSFRGDLTLPRRRLNRASLAPLLRGNALHMSFRVSKRRDHHC